MPDEQDANKQNNNGNDAADSSSAKNQSQQKDSQPSAETQKTERIPFDRDPAIQDYIARQVSARWQDLMSVQGLSQRVKENVSAGMENELIEEGVDSKVAKKIVSVFSRMADDKVKSAMEPLQKDVQNLSINDKFIAFAGEHPDFENHRKAMFQIYSNLSDAEKNFIENSPNGIDFLYSKAKVLSGSGVNAQSKMPGNPPANRAGIKISESNVWANKAAEALSKGDKKAYGEAIANLNAGR